MAKRERRFELGDFFGFTPPSEDQKARMTAVRAAAKVFAEAIVANVKPCEDRGQALLLTRSAMLTANEGVIHGDKNANVDIDNELPGGPEDEIDNELPEGPSTPDNTLPNPPGWPTEPDNTLPSDPNYPDQGLPGSGATPKKSK